MKYLKTLLIVASLQSVAFGFSYVNSSSFTSVGGSVGTSTITLTAGQLVVVSCFEFAGSNCGLTISDSLGNTFNTAINNVIGYSDSAAPQSCTNEWYIKNALGGSDVITCKDFTNFPSLIYGSVLNYTGQNPTALYDVSASSSQVHPAANPAVSLTPNNNGELVVSFLYGFQQPSGSGNGTLRLQASGTNQYESVQDGIAGLSTYTSSWVASAQFFPFIFLQTAYVPATTSASSLLYTSGSGGRLSIKGTGGQLTVH